MDLAPEFAALGVPSPKNASPKFAALNATKEALPKEAVPKFAALGPAVSVEPTLKKNTVKTLEKLKREESPEEILMATLQLNPFNVAGSISSEFDLFRPCREVPVWDNLTSDDLYAAITSTSYKDPRDLKGACVFVGDAKATTEPSNIMSYCVGDKCAVKVCFDLAELKNHLHDPKSLNKNGLHVNKWTKEIKGNAEIPKDIRDNVEDEMSDDWVQAVHCQLFALEEKHRIKSITQDSFFNLAVEGLVAYFMEHPWAMSVGSFFSKIKGTATVMAWMKSVASSMHSLNSYIKNNAFTTNFCLIISKLARTCLCLYFSGAAVDTVTMLFDHFLLMATDNVIVKFLLNICKLLLQCVLKLVLPTPMNIWECVQTVFSSIKTVGQFSAYLVNASFSILRYVISKMAGTQIESFFSVCSSLNLNAYFNITPDEFHKALLPVLKPAFSRDLNFTLFLLMLSMFPVRFFAGGLVLILRFGSKNKYIESTVLLFKNVMEKFEGKIDNVAQLILFCLHTSPEAINIYRTLMEIYYWVFDVGSCLLLKYIYPLKNLMYSMLSITGHPHKEVTSVACCFKNFVSGFTDVLNLDSTKALMDLKHMKTGGTGGQAKFILHNTDLRLKHLILNTPIFSILFMDKPVNFYLYRWNLEEGKKFGLTLNTSAHIGLVAQEFETRFPEHVTTLDNGLRDVVNLPCELQQILAGLNGAQLPKCQTRFRRLKLTQGPRLL
jgi:hypothetical protein